MSIQAAYYAVQSACKITEIALEYKKVQEMSMLRTEIERNRLILDSLRSYCDLIDESMQTLMHMFFRSAYENLKYALSASDENRNAYLRQAINRFVDATTIEKNENKILSYIGLALCQAICSDNLNSMNTLRRIKDVYCETPNDLEVLDQFERGSGRGFNVLQFFLYYFFHYHFRRLCCRTTSEIDTILENCCNDYLKEKDYCNGISKDILKRRMFAFLKGGGLYTNEKIIQESLVKLVKNIQQDEFEAFKSEILLQFKLLE